MQTQTFPPDKWLQPDEPFTSLHGGMADPGLPRLSLSKRRISAATRASRVANDFIIESGRVRGPIKCSR